MLYEPIDFCPNRTFHLATRGRFVKKAVYCCYRFGMYKLKVYFMIFGGKVYIRILHEPIDFRPNRTFHLATRGRFVKTAVYCCYRFSMYKFKVFFMIFGGKVYIKILHEPIDFRPNQTFHLATRGRFLKMAYTMLLL